MTQTPRIPGATGAVILTMALCSPALAATGSLSGQVEALPDVAEPGGTLVWVTVDRYEPTGERVAVADAEVVLDPDGGFTLTDVTSDAELLVVSALDSATGETLGAGLVPAGLDDGNDVALPPFTPATSLAAEVWDEVLADPELGARPDELSPVLLIALIDDGVAEAAREFGLARGALGRGFLGANRAFFGALGRLGPGIGTGRVHRALGLGFRGLGRFGTGPGVAPLGLGRLGLGFGGIWPTGFARFRALGAGYPGFGSGYPGAAAWGGPILGGGSLAPTFLYGGLASCGVNPLDAALAFQAAAAAWAPLVYGLAAPYGSPGMDLGLAATRGAAGVQGLFGLNAANLALLAANRPLNVGYGMGNLGQAVHAARSFGGIAGAQASIAPWLLGGPRMGIGTLGPGIGGSRVGQLQGVYQQAFGAEPGSLQAYADALGIADAEVRALRDHVRQAWEIGGIQWAAPPEAFGRFGEAVGDAYARFQTDLGAELDRQALGGGADDEIAGCVNAVICAVRAGQLVDPFGGGGAGD